MKNKIYEKQTLIFIMIILVFVITTSMMPIFIHAETSTKTESIVLNYSTYTLKKGNTIKLKALVTLKESKKYKLIWESSKNSVASVNNKGVVKGKKKGHTIISVTVKGTSLKASCKIMVETQEETSIQTGNLGEINLEKKSKELLELITEAKKQFEADDHTPLSEPVAYKILWLGYTHVIYDQLDFRMTDFDREYLQAVALNFENVVEKYANYNIDISIDLHFIDKTTPLSKLDTLSSLYIAKNTIQSDIDNYMGQEYYDTVFTTIQTKGSGNVRRNKGKPGYVGHDYVVGLKSQGMEDALGYSTFNLCEPKEGTYPLEDPQIPSLYATALAVHEWLHQLEYLGELLEIEYPNTHAYQGSEKYPGYRTIIADEDDYDYFAFYKNVLSGTLSYTDENGIRNVGIYPKMWRLIKRDVLNIGSATIKSSSGDFYLTGQEKEPNVTTVAQVNQWLIRYGGTKGYILISETLPQKQLTLSNAWDQEGNYLHMFQHNSYYPEAQLWQFTKNADNTYCIRTAYSSGRVVTVEKPGETAVIQSVKTPNSEQKWILSISPTK